MKRRKFVQSLLVAPVVPAAVEAQQTAPQQPSGPQPNTPARQLSRQPQNVPQLATIQADLASETDQRFFSQDQFAALQKLGSILMPPLKSRPGALDAKAPEFLDFLIGASPADRQKLYCDGLDGLNAQAKKQYGKPFSELDAKQADTIIRPLLVAIPWPQDMPQDPMKNFLAQVHEDLRTATMNSREWADASPGSGRVRQIFGRGMGYYWKPIDPVVRD
jgi:gluconate 2-dehydrogenase subunit 3-like protein